MLLIAIPAWVYGSEKKHEEGNLSVSQLKSIRAVGKNVLAAKKKAPRDKELQQLRLDLEALRNELKTVHHHLLSSIRSERGAQIVISTKKDTGIARAPGKPVKAELDTAVGRTRLQLDKVKEAKRVISSRLKPESSAKQDVVKNKAVAKVQELESEIEAILAEEVSITQTKRLEMLLERMQARPVASPATMDQKPHIRTIVHHRR